MYVLAINRIRHYYTEIAGSRADPFLLSGHDDGVGVFENMGLPADRSGARSRAHKILA